MTGRKASRDALRFWLKQTGLSQVELAERTGLSQNYISQLNTGARDGTIESLQQIALGFGVSLSGFFACADSGLPELDFVPKVKARPLAGTGGLEVDGDYEGLYAFPASFLRRKGGSAGTMRIFEVDGDSMEPVLRAGDRVMINQRMADISSGHIYLLRLEGELMIKRLERRPGGIVLIRSDNPAYEDMEVQPAGMECLDFAVFGKMVWMCREF